MKFSVLTSGSSGNLTYVEGGGIRLLIDVGVSCRKIEQLLATIDVPPSSINAILITHEHVDHVRGLQRFGEKYKVDIYANEGTAAVVERQIRRENKTPPPFVLFESNIPFMLGDLTVTPVRISHDTAEPVGYLIEENQTTFGLFTDLGVAPERITTMMAQCHALVLESNHDLEMLKNSNRGYALISRISGASGHLSNMQACEALLNAAPASLQTLVLAHLSGECNQPEVAHAMMARTLQLMHREEVQLHVASQTVPLPLMTIDCP
jgi:phosphoribosyl 1,2-cyclic phosphodiesterase